MIPGKPTIDIYFGKGETIKIEIDGVDYSKANYLLIEFTPEKVRYLVGTMPPKEKQVKDEHS